MEINMGGNVTALNKKDNSEVRAERIDLNAIDRTSFVNKTNELLQTINKQNNYALWAPGVLEKCFNGSTSYVMDQNILDEVILKHKPIIGDIDVMVPVEVKDSLWYYLDSIEGQYLGDVQYAGCNKHTIASIGNQINSVFVFDFDGVKLPIQIDFEFVDFIDSYPSEWANFSHSSTLTDAKLNIKAVHHKFLIRSLVGGASYRDDIVISTPKSTHDNITLSKSKDHLYPRMLKFSVDRGIREAYEPLTNDGKNIIIDGKKVYRPLSTSESVFVTNVEDIFKLSFQREPTNNDIELFNSFVGVVELMKKHFNKKQIKDTTDRYIALLWGFNGQRGQELERSDPSSDYSVKESGYTYYINELNLPDEREQFVSEYYKTYRME